MKQNFDNFKNDVDLWVKDLSSEINTLKHIPAVVADHSENIDHNYELLQEMRAEIRKLNEEIQALRMIQLLHLKADVRQKN